jgi:hypothetical protein
VSREIVVCEGQEDDWRIERREDGLMSKKLVVEK